MHSDISFMAIYTPFSFFHLLKVKLKQEEQVGRLFCIALSVPRTHGSHAETLHLLSLIQRLNITIQSEGVHEHKSCFLPHGRPIEKWINRHAIVTEVEFKRALLYRLIGTREPTLDSDVEDGCSSDDSSDDDDDDASMGGWERKARKIPCLRRYLRILEPSMQLLLFLKKMEWTVDLDDVLEVIMAIDKPTPLLPLPPLPLHF